MMCDKIICNSLQYEVQIGFHEYEMGVRQKIMVDLEAWFPPLRKDEAENIKALRFDYYEANGCIESLLHSTPYKLLETVAESIAGRLLLKFRIQKIQVKVTKFPLDMPNAHSVSYICTREKPE